MSPKTPKIPMGKFSPNTPESNRRYSKNITRQLKERERHSESPKRLRPKSPWTPTKSAAAKRNKKDDSNQTRGRPGK